MTILTARPTPALAVITLNRREKRNAVDGVLARALIGAVAEVEADPDVRIGILAGNGPVFCAGADLSALNGDDHADIFNFEAGFAGFTAYPRAKVWIAAVEGPALGGGFELALACDLIIASETTWFSLPEVKHGALAVGGGIERLAAALPHPVARGLILTGGRLTAARAYQLGLVTELTEPGGALAVALVLAAEIAAHPKDAVRASLALAKKAGSSDFTRCAIEALACLESKRR